MNGNGITTLKGDKIGPWKLGSTLGIGSTGKVVMASNENTGQQAAVKIISKSIFNAQGSTIIGGNDPDVLPYGIEREIIIMKLLNHPNVLRLYD
ncbi:serine/threonine-protein kinase gin4, partial [Kluyveromyces marxianus]